ncbi:MAG: hypothetical protein A3J65_00055 [Candidatus Buchananbacteria bacterium RIFCSPHIGHO2_02_FULL_45_11b]|nr:MAG: hypothetical protein A3J65_00055 [Candidatus Buchananbacteria bacterium RIFCSPHIGHO2_02_FULL_45_11b]
MKKFLEINRDFLAGALIFFLVMAVYLFTLAPNIVMEDSGEYVSAAYTLGIAHPSGYPLWVILAKLFTFIPLGSLAWRINLMSAVFGALTAVLLYFVSRKLVKSRLVAFCASLLLAFSPTFWSQSVLAEVYTLNSFFAALLILILLGWRENKKNSYLLWFALFYGLGLTNHTMLALFAPVFIVYILWYLPNQPVILTGQELFFFKPPKNWKKLSDLTAWLLFLPLSLPGFIDRRIFRNWKIILKMFLLFLAGLSVYGFLPIRSWQKAEFVWVSLNGWQNVLTHILRAQYHDFAPWASLHDKTGLVIYFFVEIALQFFWPALFLALAGAIYLWRLNRPVFILSAGVFLLNSLGIIYLRKFGFGAGISYTYRVYYLPAFLIAAFWLAVILDYLYGFLTAFLAKRSARILKTAQIAFILVLLSLPVDFVIANYRANDLSDFWLNYDYTKNLLAGLEPNGVYFFAFDGSLQADTELFSLIYLKLVENFRPDVAVVSDHNFFRKDVQLVYPADYIKLSLDERNRVIFNLLNEVIKDRPIYTNFAVTRKSNDKKLFGLSNGYVFRIYPSLAEARKAKLPGDFSAIRNLAEVDELSEYPVKGMAAHYYYNLAAYYLTAGHKAESQKYLAKAVLLDNLPFSHEYVRFLDYRR